jgi:hypothetical protein
MAPKCKKCKVALPPEAKEHTCEGCGLRLCRTCDDRSDTLSWVEITIELPDKYLCKKCRSKGNDASIDGEKGGVVNRDLVVVGNDFHKDGNTG